MGGLPWVTTVFQGRLINYNKKTVRLKAHRSLKNKIYYSFLSAPGQQEDVPSSLVAHVLPHKLLQQQL